MSRPAPTAAEVAAGLCDVSLGAEFNDGCEMVAYAPLAGLAEFILDWEPEIDFDKDYSPGDEQAVRFKVRVERFPA